MNDSIILLFKIALMLFLLLCVMILAVIVAGMLGSAIYSFLTFLKEWLDDRKW